MCLCVLRFCLNVMFKFDISSLILESCPHMSSLAVSVLCIFFHKDYTWYESFFMLSSWGFLPIWAVNALVFTCWDNIFCRAFSGFNLHIVCIKFLREAFRYDYPGWVFFFFLISYFSASFSSVFIYHFFNCFLNLFGFSVLSSSGMML